MPVFDDDGSIRRMLMRNVPKPQHGESIEQIMDFLAKNEAKEGKPFDVGEVAIRAMKVKNQDGMGGRRYWLSRGPPPISPIFLCLWLINTGLRCVIEQPIATAVTAAAVGAQSFISCDEATTNRHTSTGCRKQC